MQQLGIATDVIGRPSPLMMPILCAISWTHHLSEEDGWLSSSFVADDIRRRPLPLSEPAPTGLTSAVAVAGALTWFH